jgi:hypothetical protein
MKEGMYSNKRENNQSEIARTLQVDKSVIGRNVAYLDNNRHKYQNIHRRKTTRRI